jgi:hypothetical protein
MELSKLGVAIAAASCLTVGAVAGYLSTRGDAPDPTALEAPASPEFETFGGNEAPPFDEREWSGVEASEDIVAPAPVRPEPVRPAPSAPAARPAPRPQPAPAPAVADSEPEPLREPVETFTEVTPIAPAPLEPAPLPAPPIAAVPAPPGPEVYEIELVADSVIGLQVETGVSSETAQVEDEVVARVTRDVKVGGHVAIPAGSTAHGEVTLVERGGRMRERARLGVRFTSIVLADGTRLPISTETVFREGDSPGRESATKIGGGAIGGAILGGILGGAKGAAIGGSIGAGAGSAAVLAGGRNAATLSAGSPVTVRLEEAVIVEVEK